MKRKTFQRTFLTLEIIFFLVGITITPSIVADFSKDDGVTRVSYASPVSEDPGTLSGYVTDTAMHPIEGARVRVYFHNTSREDYSNITGYYHVTDIPICNCTKNATCSKQGFSTAWVYLSIWENTTHDFILIKNNHWLYVGGSGPENYTRIQDAINNASDGDTIFVYPGTYYEHLVINKSIFLCGQQVNSTIIDGGGNGTVVIIKATATVSGFTIQHSGQVLTYDAGIRNYDIPEFSYTFTLSGNCLRNNKNGIFIRNSHNDSITQNTFMNNEQGVCLFLSSDCDIHQNTFLNNTNQSFFTYFFLLQRFPRNHWNENYWDDWHSVLPRPIRGVKEVIYLVLRPGMVFSIPIPWINFDWHPAQEPYPTGG